VRKIYFLEVVIGLEEIKIEKEKVKAMLDWLVSKLVKEIQNRVGKLLQKICRRICKDSETII